MKKILLSENYRFISLLICLSLLIIVQPIIQNFPLAKNIFSLLITINILASIWAFREYKTIFIICLVLAVPTITTEWWVDVYPGPYAMHVSIALNMLFFSVVAIGLTMHVVRTKTASVNAIAGAISGYLMIGIAFAMLYVLMDSLLVDAIKFPGDAQQLGKGYNFFPSYAYYSFTVLTTLGFGDITPRTDLLRLVTIAEAIIGQLFLTVLIARLVGINISNHMRSDS